MSLFYKNEMCSLVQVAQRAGWKLSWDDASEHVLLHREGVAVYSYPPSLHGEVQLRQKLDQLLEEENREDLRGPVTAAADRVALACGAGVREAEEVLF